MKSVKRHMKFLFSLVLIFCVDTASAHSFNLVLIAPISELTGQEARHGFMLATREQDSHADETSDGHLGGLDSHVYMVDSALGVESSNQQLRETIREHAPIFATGLNIDPALLNTLVESTIVLVDPVSSDVWLASIESPDNINLMNGGLFTEAFRSSYNYAASLPAIHGYISARAIASAVRNSSDEEDLSNPVKLRKLIDDFLRKPTL